MRLNPILRAADTEAGGGPSGDEVVTISRAELEDLLARAGSAPPATVDPDAQAETIRARDDAHGREIAARDRKAAELERAYKAALLDRELATALAGKPLVAGAATQLIKLWRDEFEVSERDGAIHVHARDGREVAPAVAERLAGPEFAHFCLPSSRGGTAARGQNRPASTPSEAEPATPRTLGEAVLRQWREAAARSQDAPQPPGWGRRR